MSDANQTIQTNTDTNPPEINITIQKIKRFQTIKCHICSKLIWPWQKQFVNEVHFKCFLKKLEDTGLKIKKITIDGIEVDYKKR